jgi:hypothetical protein
MAKPETRTQSWLMDKASDTSPQTISHCSNAHAPKEVGSPSTHALRQADRTVLYSKPAPAAIGPDSSPLRAETTPRGEDAATMMLSCQEDSNTRMHELSHPKTTSRMQKSHHQELASPSRMSSQQGPAQGSPRG